MKRIMQVTAIPFPSSRSVQAVISRVVRPQPDGTGSIGTVTDCPICLSVIRWGIIWATDLPERFSEVLEIWSLRPTALGVQDWERASISLALPTYLSVSTERRQLPLQSFLMQTSTVMDYPTWLVEMAIKWKFPSIRVRALSMTSTTERGAQAEALPHLYPVTEMRLLSSAYICYSWNFPWHQV